MSKYRRSKEPYIRAQLNIFDELIVDNFAGGGGASTGIELLETLIKHPGPVLLSGYHSALYDEILEGWHMEEHQSRNQRNRTVKEVLWMNFNPERQLKFY